MTDPRPPDPDSSRDEHGPTLTELFEQAPGQGRPAHEQDPTASPAGADLTALAESAEPVTVETPRGGLRRALRIGGLVLLVPVVLGLLVVAGWAVDSLVTGDGVARGTEVRGVDVGAMSEDDLWAELRVMADELAARPVTIETPEGALDTTAGELGLALDVDATARAAIDVGRSEPLPGRPWSWVGALVSGRSAPVTYRINRTLVEHRVADLEATNEVAPVEPTITPTDSGWEVVPGESGEVLDTTMITDELEAELLDDADPISITLEPVVTEPRFTDDQARELAAEAERLTAGPLTVQVAGQSAALDPATLRTFFAPEAGEDELDLRFDEEAANDWLTRSFDALHVDPVDARFEIGFGVGIQPSQDGRTCCAPGSVDAIRQALDAEQAAVDLELEVLEPRLTTAEAEGLGVSEPVASFTTNHACCEARVDNIHRMADLVRGAVILPGESFSVNDHVGPRTREKGFKESGAIYAGVFVEDVGGGVSQFATTLFNAAFFAGLEYDEYQAHTIYIDRYPYGREATISFPAPDLEIHNPSPHGVVIWPTYTGSSITVTLWSTPWVEADQTAQREAGIANGCTRVTTERTRVFGSADEAERIRGGPPPEGVDPREVVDTVFAVYQPAEGVRC